MSSTADLVAAYLAKGGVITKEAPQVSPEERRHRENNQDRRYCNRAYSAYEALRGDAQPNNVDWWACCPIGFCDPCRALKEAAAVYVIARDEGRNSAELYRNELTNPPEKEAL